MIFFCYFILELFLRRCYSENYKILHYILWKIAAYWNYVTSFLFRRALCNIIKRLLWSRYLSRDIFSFNRCWYTSAPQKLCNLNETNCYAQESKRNKTIQGSSACAWEPLQRSVYVSRHNASVLESLSIIYVVKLDSHFRHRCTSIRDFLNVLASLCRYL